VVGRPANSVPYHEALTIWTGGAGGRIGVFAMGAGRCGATTVAGVAHPEAINDGASTVIRRTRSKNRWPINARMARIPNLEAYEHHRQIAEPMTDAADCDSQAAISANRLSTHESER